MILILIFYKDLLGGQYNNKEFYLLSNNIGKTLNNIK